jgi:protein kinase X
LVCCCDLTASQPENLLFSAAGHIKITDFGFAKRVGVDKTYTVCGTPEYLSPEAIQVRRSFRFLCLQRSSAASLMRSVQGSPCEVWAVPCFPVAESQTRGHGIPVDWWALGVLIYEMLAGLPPFFDETPYGIYQKILKGRLRFPRGFDVKASDLVAKLLTMDPTRRLGEPKRTASCRSRALWQPRVVERLCVNVVTMLSRSLCLSGCRVSEGRSGRRSSPPLVRKA